VLERARSGEFFAPSSADVEAAEAIRLKFELSFIAGEMIQPDAC